MKLEIKAQIIEAWNSAMVKRKNSDIQVFSGCTIPEENSVKT